MIAVKPKINMITHTQHHPHVKHETLNHSVVFPSPPSTIFAFHFFPNVSVFTSLHHVSCALLLSLVSLLVCLSSEECRDDEEEKVEQVEGEGLSGCWSLTVV